MVQNEVWVICIRRKSLPHSSQMVPMKRSTAGRDASHCTDHVFHWTFHRGILAIMGCSSGQGSWSQHPNENENFLRGINSTTLDAPGCDIVTYSHRAYSSPVTVYNQPDQLSAEANCDPIVSEKSDLGRAVICPVHFLLSPYSILGHSQTMNHHSI